MRHRAILFSINPTTKLSKALRVTINTHFKIRVNKGKIEIPVEYQDEIRNAEMVQIVILQPALDKKRFPQKGIIAQLRD